MRPLKVLESLQKERINIKSSAQQTIAQNSNVTISFDAILALEGSAKTLGNSIAVAERKVAEDDRLPAC